jgi:hypothetical protein
MRVWRIVPPPLPGVGWTRGRRSGRSEVVLRRAEREAMANVDSAWLRMEDATNLMTITGLMTFETPLDFTRFKEVIEDRLICHDRFRSKVVESLLPL